MWKFLKKLLLFLIIFSCLLCGCKKTTDDNIDKSLSLNEIGNGLWYNLNTYNIYWWNGRSGTDSMNRTANDTIPTPYYDCNGKICEYTKNEASYRGTEALFPISAGLWYDQDTNIVYMWNGRLGDGPLSRTPNDTTPSAYYASNGLPYVYSLENGEITMLEINNASTP